MPAAPLPTAITSNSGSSALTRTGYSFSTGGDNMDWDERADVVVVGFGAAGACTAIEAADAGADVLVLDRFGGGGASALSGGVVYAGGGTAYQRAAGVDDSPEAMYAYLATEVGDVVSAAPLRAFCRDSA